jgi:MYXO-CTERM domain-containing protein
MACSYSNRDSLSATDQAVLGGEVSGAEDDAVVKVEAQSASGAIWNCSGTLVAPNLMLTARHCISNFAEGTFSCDSDGNLTSFKGAGMMGALDTPGNITVRRGTGPKTTRVAKGQAIFAPLTTVICVNDIALVVLDQPLNDIPIKPIRLYSGVAPGEQITVIGYGTDDEGDVGTRHTRSGLTIAQVGPSPFRPVADPIPPRTFLTQGPALCVVDSGGPALSDNGAVVGTFSIDVGDCHSADAKNVYTQVAPYLDDVVLPAFEAAGYDPWLEGNSEPGLYGLGGTGNSGGDAATGGDTAAPNASGGSANAQTGGASTGGAPTGGVPAATGGVPNATGGDTSLPAVYDQAPPSGGNCACRVSGARRSGLGILAAVAAGLLARRRKRRTG